MVAIHPTELRLLATLARSGPADPRVTDHRFVLVIEEADAVFDPVKVHELLKRFHVVRVEEREEAR